MAFPTQPGKAARSLIDDAAHELLVSPKYRLLLEAMRHRAYKLLNDALPLGPSGVDQGRLLAYVEIYKLLSNGKDLFDAGTPP